MTTETMEYPGKATSYMTWYFRYTGDPLPGSLQKNIDAFQSEILKITDNEKEQLPLLKWSLANGDNVTDTILRVQVSTISSNGSVFMTVTQPIAPTPGPVPRKPHDFEFVDPQVFNEMNVNWI